MVTIGRDRLLLPPRLYRLAALLLSASISGLFWTVAFAIAARALDLAFGATAFMAFVELWRHAPLWVLPFA